MVRFLLIPFQLRHICGQVTQKRIKKALRNIPTAVDEVFEDTLNRIKLKGHAAYQLASKVFAWMIYATRPLHVEELLEAVAIEEWSNGQDLDDCIQEDFMMECCMGFIVVRTTDHTVHFSHYSIQQYLESRRELLPSNLYLAKCCLTYLMYNHFETYISDLSRVMYAYPFLRYAAENWM